MYQFNGQYMKINSIYKRDENKRIIIGDYAQEEYKYLENNLWLGTEKIDGTNIRVSYDGETKALLFNGKTNDANTPQFLIDKLHSMFNVDQMDKIFSTAKVTLYGEGYGAKIQKGGGNYIPDGQSFILFDVVIDGWLLKRFDVVDLAYKLGIDTVKIIGEATLLDWVEMIKSKTLKSVFGNFLAEGVVVTPIVDIFNRKGERIITKIKHKDF